MLKGKNGNTGFISYLFSNYFTMSSQSLDLFCYNFISQASKPFIVFHPLLWHRLAFHSTCPLYCWSSSLLRWHRIHIVHYDLSDRIDRYYDCLKSLHCTSNGTHFAYNRTQCLGTLQKLGENVKHHLHKHQHTRRNHKPS